MESPGCAVEIRVPRSPGSGWSRSWSLSFEGDNDSEPYLFYLDFCAILL